MKSVLISTQPKWVEKICHKIGEENGKPIYEKRVEVRKTKPRCEVPFKCYIYETQGKRIRLSDIFYGYEGSKKVIGEFICDRIDEYECEFVDDDCLETVYLIDREECEDEDYPDRTLIWNNEGDNYNFNTDDEIIKCSCVPYKDLKKYIGYGFNTFYGWHISDLVIYDKPRELSEFYNNCNGLCFDSSIKYKCIRLNTDNPYACDHIKPLTRPFQSWGYVYESDN